MSRARTLTAEKWAGNRLYTDTVQVCTGCQPTATVQDVRGRAVGAVEAPLLQQCLRVSVRFAVGRRVVGLVGVVGRYRRRGGAGQRLDRGGAVVQPIVDIRRPARRRGVDRHRHRGRCREQDVAVDTQRRELQHVVAGRRGQVGEGKGRLGPRGRSRAGPR